MSRPSYVGSYFQVMWSCGLLATEKERRNAWNDKEHYLHCSKMVFVWLPEKPWQDFFLEGAVLLIEASLPVSIMFPA